MIKKISECCKDVKNLLLLIYVRSMYIISGIENDIKQILHTYTIKLMSKKKT